MLKWIEERTGLGTLLRGALFENIPGGARWRYVWGSTLTFTFFVQIITGIFLWMAYNPSTQTAWESVYYIQNEMTLGWLLRAVHHYTANAMIVLLALHLMQVVIDGAYRAPREVNFWFGIGLLMLVLALSLTGYLLPWDQKGYWATKVTTSLMNQIPGVGKEVEQLAIGGSEYGHHTLSRFFALHAGVLPGAMIALIVGHVYLFRRHGITAKKPLRKPDGWFWPDQFLKDTVACLAVIAVVLYLSLDTWIWGQGELGAPLGAPADPTQPFDARPEWYFLFLFQLLKYFPGELEIYGTLVIPGAVVLLIGLMPFIGRWQLGHRFNLAVLFALLLGVGALTSLAIYEDSNPQYAKNLQQARETAARVKVLAQAPPEGQGIPAQGALELLRNDSLTQGPKIFAEHCASCHRYDGHDGLGNEPEEAPSAADLAGFASRDWLSRLVSVEHIATDKFFGNTEFKEGKMVSFVQRKVANFDKAEKDQLSKALIALSAEAQLPAQRTMDRNDAGTIEAGKNHLLDDVGCADCHQFHFEDEDLTAPDLTGYGSKSWLVDMIGDPEHRRFYGDKNDRMPSFLRDGILTDRAVDLVADWLRNDWFEPGGDLAQ